MQGARQTLAVNFLDFLDTFSTMCTIAFLLDIVAGAPLVLAANRDEMYERPTRPPESLGHRVAGGVDVSSGGTWLAIRHDGRFAAVTNQRAMAPVSPGLRSRGLAVRELASAADPCGYVAALDPTMYASMNLVWGDATGVTIAYVRREGTLEVEPLRRGIHVLCNDRLGAPGCPRGERLYDALLGARPRWPELLPVLQAEFADHTRVDPPASHLPLEVARELTATCIHTPAYGTRSSTIIAARPGETIAYLHADGPPCTTPYVDRKALL